MPTQDDVRRIHAAEPRLSAPEIAKRLDCHPGYVRATAQRLGLRLPKGYPDGVLSLGHAAQEAGMTLADIRQWAKERGR